MALRWLAVALAFGIPFLAGISLQDWLETRNPRSERLVPLLYLLLPLGSAMLVASIVRANL